MLALFADAENLEGMCYFCVTHLSGHSFKSVGNAKIERLDGMTDPADDVVVMMFASVEFVAISAVTEVAPPHQRDRFHCREAAIDRDEVAPASVHFLVDFIRREWPVLLREYGEHRATRRGDALAVTTHGLQRRFERRRGRKMRVRHAKEKFPAPCFHEKDFAN